MRTAYVTQVALSADEVADLNAVAARLGVHGDRHNAALVGLRTADVLFLYASLGSRP